MPPVSKNSCKIRSSNLRNNFAIARLQKAQFTKASFETVEKASLGLASGRSSSILRRKSHKERVPRYSIRFTRPKDQTFGTCATLKWRSDHGQQVGLTSAQCGSTEFSSTAR